MRKVVVLKASHQKDKGIAAWANKVKHISTMCLCFLSTLPFC